MIGILLADGTDDLDPVGRLDLTAPLLAVAVACVATAVVLIVAIVLLSRPKRTVARRGAHGVHVDGGMLARWRRRVDDVVRRHHDGSLSREESFVELADIARRFASEASGTDMRASTLSDLAVMPRTDGNRRSLDLLKQTISALYPAEFADSGLNRIAGETSVDEAAGWVSNLMERWR
ncbi:hypothetical protein [Bifidobacterium simiiventris]|uniref:hypothetical protein n=1 Tax=Bifidobacterium simiiventris TaxID=2834434 RepID=UPI001C579282|nr:hypothetical protein [Bifidobacterium simiiventris]MBW3078142.1 hypothetical protein [Bifidobacterium simiiventris]